MSWVRGGRVDVEVRVEVLVHLAALEEEREGVAPRVGAADLEDLHGVVREVVVEHKGAELAVERLAVVPREVEAEDLAVVLEELVELVRLQQRRRAAQPRLDVADEVVVGAARVVLWLRVICIFISSRVMVYGSAGIGSATRCRGW